MASPSEPGEGLRSRRRALAPPATRGIGEPGQGRRDRRALVSHPDLDDIGIAEVPLETLWHVIPSFPTLSEVWLRLLETYGL